MELSGVLCYTSSQEKRGKPIAAQSNYDKEESVMIRWKQQETGEGEFDSQFFRNEDGNTLCVYANGDSPDWMACAERCVEAFNHLPDAVIQELCKQLTDCAQAGDGLEEEFELPPLENPQAILEYCWFVALYVDMENEDDEIAYAVEGEGEWGENIGFYIQNNRVVYVGPDYLTYMKHG